MVKSRNWNEIIKFYQNLDIGIMSDFVEQISNSRYAHGVFATTSMFHLWVSQNSEFDIDKNMIRVEFENDKFLFRYKESPYSNKEWKKECDKHRGFSTFEHIMKKLKWFLS